MRNQLLPPALASLLASPAHATLEAAEVVCDYAFSRIDASRHKTLSLMSDYSGLTPTKLPHIFRVMHPMGHDIKIDIKSKMWLETTEKGQAYGKLLFHEMLPEWADADETLPSTHYLIG